MENYNRFEFASLIFNKIENNKEILKKQFSSSSNEIGFFYLDDLLPIEMVKHINASFPSSSQMILKKSLREDKYIAAQMNLYNPILEEIIFAFQDSRIVELIASICNVKQAIPDKSLYAGGISMMGKNQFLNPHLDNSHDNDREYWRVLNLLFYITPNWKESYGGNLELWPNGLNETQTTIHSKFNRLVVMATHNNSLHSVSPVVFDGYRCCISNYYFSKNPLFESDTFHVTSFRGRPENKVSDLILQIDAFFRMNLRKFFKKGIIKNPHIYKK